MLQGLQGIEGAGQLLQEVKPETYSKPDELLLLMTHGMSLQKWHELGLFDREILIYKRLVALGWQVKIATFGDISEYSFIKDLDGIEVIPLYWKAWQARFWLTRFIVPVVRVITSPHQFKGISVVKTNQVWGGWIAVLIKLIYRVPVLARSGYDLFSFCLRDRTDFRMIFLSWIASKFLYSFADKIHVATSEDRDALSRYGTDVVGKCEVFPNWIDTEKFRPRPDHGDKIFDVIAVGRLEQQKSYKTLIRSLAGTRLRGLIIGSGSEESELKALAKRLGSDVDFIERVSNDALPEFLRKSRIYCMTSHYEGCPKAMLEAMATGLPTVAVDAPGVSPVVRAAGAGLIVQRNNVELKEALLEMRHNEELYNRLRVLAPPFIQNHYSLNTIIIQEQQALIALSR